LYSFSGGKLIKKIIAWPITNLLYYIGDFISLVMESIDTEWAFDILHPVYNWFMCTSCTVNDWAGLDLWTENENTYQCPKCGTEYFEELNECNWCPGVKLNGPN
jgi:hypothetical protein